MVTYVQLGRRCRAYQPRFSWARQLFQCPQVRGRVVKVLTVAPKKPNSARRKTAKVVLVNRKLIFAKLIGEGHPPQKFSLVLVRGGGFKDTPQVNYTMIRGVLECLALFSKRRRRSIFGAPRIDVVAAAV